MLPRLLIAFTPPCRYAADGGHTLYYMPQRGTPLRHFDTLPLAISLLQNSADILLSAAGYAMIFAIDAAAVIISLDFSPLRHAYFRFSLPPLPKAFKSASLLLPMRFMRYICH